MTVHNRETLDPNQTAHQLGYDLAQSGQTFGEAIGNLNVSLVTLGCEPGISAEEIQGSWPSFVMKVGSQPFTRAVRAATYCLIMRPYELAPAPETVSQTMKETMANSTEGATWIDPEAQATRKQIAAQNAGLLLSMMGGLAEAGYPASKTRSDMREEFDELLDGLWSRGSYGSFPESKIIADTMKATGIRNVNSRLHSVRRFRSFQKDYGFGLALTRIFPEEILGDR